jgi:hypothetical protein
MTQRWIDPRIIDFADGLNPLRVPNLRRKSYFAQALSSPLMMALRTAGGYSMMLEAVPGRGSGSIPGKGSWDDTLLRLPPESWIVALSAWSQQAEGFSAQITVGDHPPWPAPVANGNVTGSPQYFLPQPLAVIQPDRVSVRLINKSALANSVQLVFWIVGREQGSAE